MPYTSSYTDYPTNAPRPDIDGQVTWVQAHLIQNYSADKYIVVDKEIKGGLHRVKYFSQLLDLTYDGIFNSRRVKGMMCYVESTDVDDPLNKYYSLTTLPGTAKEHWTEVGSGAAVTLNNPKTVATLADRTALETVALTGTATTAAGNTNVNGTGTNWAGPDAEIAVGDEFRFGSTEYYFVESILNEGSLKTTTATLAHTNQIMYKVVVQPNDFVNVTDARTPAEVTANVPPYSASYIWDGNQWLRIYPYATDPNSHVKNNDTQIIITGQGNMPLTGNDIWYHMNNIRYHKSFNDAVSIEDIALDNDDGLGNGTQAYSSRKIAQELLLRPAVKLDGSGDDTLFLNQNGQWATPAGGGGGGGSTINNGDIFGGGGSNDNYYL